MGVNTTKVGRHQAASDDRRILGADSVALENRVDEAAGFGGVHVHLGVGVLFVRHLSGCSVFCLRNPEIVIQGEASDKCIENLKLSLNTLSSSHCSASGLVVMSPRMRKSVRRKSLWGLESSDRLPRRV